MTFMTGSAGQSTEWNRDMSQVAQRQLDAIVTLRIGRHDKQLIENEALRRGVTTKQVLQAAGLNALIARLRKRSPK